MFNFLKNDSSVELELREWALRDCLACAPASDHIEWQQHFADVDLKYLVTETAAKCLTKMRGAQWAAKIGDPTLNLSLGEVLRFTKGLSLAKEVAKRRSWQLQFDGSDAFGYLCRVK